MLCTESQWWHTVHMQCRLFVEHDGRKASEIRLSPANQARASSSQKTTNAAPALIYANLLQPETLSLNQWTPPPSRNRGGCIRRSSWHSLLFLAFLFQSLLGNVDDSSGGVPLGAAFLPPLPTPGFAFFWFHQNLT